MSKFGQFAVSKIFLPSRRYPGKRRQGKPLGGYGIFSCPVCRNQEPMNKFDRMTTYSVEAARYSYKMMASSFSSLQDALDSVEHSGATTGIDLSIFMSAWQFIDMGFRFGRVLAQVRGLKHKNENYKKVEKALIDIEKARNYIQHLNSQLSQLTGEIYPILGAISWASKDRQKSFICALGAMPEGTSFHSLSFDTVKKEFLNDIILNIDTFSINLTQCNQQMEYGIEYLTTWADENGYLLTDDSSPSIAIIPALNGITTERYVRIYFDFNTKS